MTFAALLPHPPIAVPDVGAHFAAASLATTTNSREVARRLVRARPDRIALVSPHAPRRAGSFGIWSGGELRGDLEMFQAPAARVALPNDTDLCAELAGAAARAGLATWPIPPGLLDHGSVVPLWFLCEAGWAGPTVVLSLPADADLSQCTRFGTALAEACESREACTALIASGDGTHRARPGAPAGYAPRAIEFDQHLGAILAAGDLRAVHDIDPALRSLAAEDTCESLGVIAAAIDHVGRRPEVLSQEHPFGVGYTVAILHDANRR